MPAGFLPQFAITLLQFCPVRDGSLALRPDVIVQMAEHVIAEIDDLRWNLFQDVAAVEVHFHILCEYPCALPVIWFGDGAQISINDREVETERPRTHPHKVFLVK